MRTSETLSSDTKVNNLVSLYLKASVDFVAAGGIYVSQTRPFYFKLLIFSSILSYMYNQSRSKL